MKTLITLLLSLLLLAGCCTQKTRRAALSDVVSGLRKELTKIRDECQKPDAKCDSGQYLSEVTVELEIAHSDEKSFGVEIPVGAGKLTGGRDVTDSNTNTITLKFSNPYFEDKETAIIESCWDKKKKDLDKDCVDKNIPLHVIPGS
jgi:hypothetical protein